MADDALISTDDAVRLLLLEGPGDLEQLARAGWFPRSGKDKWRTSEVVQGRIRQLQKQVQTGPQMTQRQYAQLRNVTTKTVTTWKQIGAIVMAGDLVDVLRSDAKLEARPPSYRGGYTGTGDDDEMDSTASAIRMKETYLAKLRRIEYDKEASLVVDIAAASRSIAAKLAIVRNKLLGIGARIAPRVATLTEAAACKAVIDANVAEALGELSNYDVYRDSSGESELELESAGEDSVESVPDRPQPS